MTHDEAIGTIREALNLARKWMIRSSEFDSISEALVALDKLAAEPSEDARELVRKVLTAYGDSSMKASGYAYVAMFDESAVAEAAALITARDERIRRECLGRLQGYFAKVGKGVWMKDKDLEAIIMGKEAGE